jgi:hypothetical protein
MNSSGASWMMSFDTTNTKVFDTAQTIKNMDEVATYVEIFAYYKEVVYKGERIHPWIWFFSRRKLEQMITAKNPNSTILYNRTIQLSKRGLISASE